MLATFDSAGAGKEAGLQSSEGRKVSPVSNKFIVNESLTVPSSAAVIVDRSSSSRSPIGSVELEVTDSEAASRAVALMEEGEEDVREADMIMAAYGGTYAAVSVSDTGNNQRRSADNNVSIHCAGNPSSTADVGSNASSNKADNTITETAANGSTVTFTGDHLHADPRQLDSATGRERELGDRDMLMRSPDRPGLGARSAPKTELTIVNEGPHTSGGGRCCEDAVGIKYPPRPQEGAFSKALTTHCIDRRAGSSKTVSPCGQRPCAVEEKSHESERTTNKNVATSALVVREDTEQAPLVHDKRKAAEQDAATSQQHLCTQETVETNCGGITSQSLGGGGDSKNETVPPVYHNTEQTDATSDLDVPPPKPRRLFLRRMSSERKLKINNDSLKSEENRNIESRTPPTRPLRRKESLRQLNARSRKNNESVLPTNIDNLSGMENKSLAVENEAGEYCGSSVVGVEARVVRRCKQAGTVPRPYDSGNKWQRGNSKHAGDARSESGDAAVVPEAVAGKNRTIEVTDGASTRDNQTQDEWTCLTRADATDGSESLPEEVLLGSTISSDDCDRLSLQCEIHLNVDNCSPSTIDKSTTHCLYSNRSLRMEKSTDFSNCEIMAKTTELEDTDANSEASDKKIQSCNDNLVIPSQEASQEITNYIDDNFQVFKNSNQTEPEVKPLSEITPTLENTEFPRPPERRKRSLTKTPNSVCLENTIDAMETKNTKLPSVSKPMVPERTYRRYKSLPRQRKAKAGSSPTTQSRTTRKPVGRAASTATCRPQHSPSGLKFSTPEISSMMHYNNPTVTRPAERASVMLLMETNREHRTRSIDWSALTPRIRKSDRAASDSSIHNDVKRRISLKRTGSLKKLYSSIQRNFINKKARHSDVSESVVCFPRPKLFGRKQRRYDMKLSPDIPSEIPQLEPYTNSTSVDLVENLPDVYLFHSKLEFFEDKTYPSPVEKKRFASENECRDEKRFSEDVPPVPLRRHKRARNRTLVIETCKERSENAADSQEPLDKTADPSNDMNTSLPAEDTIVVNDACSPVALQRFSSCREPGSRGETGNEFSTDHINHNTSELCANDGTEPDNTRTPSPGTKLNPDVRKGTRDSPEDRVPSAGAQPGGGDAGDNDDVDEALLALTDALSHATSSDTGDVDSVGTCITHISEDLLDLSLNIDQTTSTTGTLTYPESCNTRNPDTTSTNIYSASDTLNEWLHDPFCDTDERLRPSNTSRDLMQCDKSTTPGSLDDTPVGSCWEPPAVSLQTWEERQGVLREKFPPLHLRKPHEDRTVAKLIGSSCPTSKIYQDTPSPGPPVDSEKEDVQHRHTHHHQQEEKQKAEEDRAQQDRCVEVYPETVRQRQRNMMASSSKVDIKNWNSSGNNNNNESQMSPAKVKKFLPSVKALRNQFEAGKTNNRSETNGNVNNTGNGTLSHRSSGSTSSLASSTLEKTSSTNSLNSASDSMENLLSPSFENQRQVDPDEPVEPIFNQFKKVDEELRDLMSKPHSTTGWNPRPLLKRLYYIPEVPKIQSQGTTYINIEGFLEKLPSGRKKATFWNAWKRRYFVAKDGVLYYYQNTQAEKPSMKMTLMGGKVECMEPNMIGVDDGKGHYVVVRCSSRQEAERWRRALETHTVEDFASQYVQPWPMPTSPALLRDTLIIDLGSASVRAGVLASQATLPQVFLPSVVATERESRRQVWGFDALAPDVRAASSVSFPIRPSHKITKYSVDLSAISSLLQKTFADLKVDPKNYHIQLSVPRVLNTNTQTELLRVLFDKFGVRSVNLTHQSILALYAYNATSGIVVDIGERMDIVPVIDGYIVDGGVSRVPYGGYRILDHLRQFLYMRNVSLINEVESYIIRHVLENICYCAHHYNTEKARCTNNPDHFEKDVSLAEYFHTKDCPFETISLDFGRFQATEGLFNPDAWGLDHPGLHKLVHKAIMECSMDIRKEMSRSIFLAGGVTQLPGLVDRLTTEIDNLTPPAIRPKVHASPYRYHAAYIGACVLAESPAFVQSRITREDWNKHGNASLRKWSL